MSSFYLLWYIQLLLESVPVSSSGHLLLAQYIFSRLSSTHEQVRLLSSRLEHLMHLPTIVVLIVFLLRNAKACLIPTLVEFGPLMPLDMLGTWGILGSALILANIVTVIIYLGFAHLGLKQKFPLWIGFLCTACLLALLYYIPHLSYVSSKLVITVCEYYSHVLIIGFAQGLALLPGISRLACTFVTACWLGYSCSQAFIFSCALQVPLISAAVLHALYSSKLSIIKHLLTRHIVTLALVTLLSYCTLELVYYAACTNKLWYLSIVLLGSIIYAFVHRNAIKKFLALAC